ncbi:MAG TPA: hypothetical protein VGB92_22765 [Longimicrobium sp.]|jgi:hypothetical protein
MSFVLRNYLQHMLTEAEYMVDTSQGLSPETFLERYPPITAWT